MLGCEIMKEDEGRRSGATKEGRGFNFALGHRRYGVLPRVMGRAVWSGFSLTESSE